MEKLNLKKENTYEIEVGDKGETIVFHMDDLELPFKWNDAFLECQKMTENLKRQIKVIEKKENKPHGLLTTQDEEVRKLYKKTFSQMRTIMDGILGKGGCQKIFGDNNYLSMFNDLFDALQPHFEKMGLSMGESVEAIEKKYGNADGSVLE